MFCPSQGWFLSYPFIAERLGVKICWVKSDFVEIFELILLVHMNGKQAISLYCHKVSVSLICIYAPPQPVILIPDLNRPFPTLPDLRQILQKYNAFINRI